jgi:hypothetical protein
MIRAYEPRFAFTRCARGTAIKRFETWRTGKLFIYKDLSTAIELCYADPTQAYGLEEFIIVHQRRSTELEQTRAKVP